MLRAGLVRSPTAGPARTRLFLTAVGEAVGMLRRSNRSPGAFHVAAALVPNGPRQGQWCARRSVLPAVVEADDGEESSKRPRRRRAALPGEGESR